MKKTASLVLLCIALTLCSTSCSKTGPAGPQGPAGTNGSNGSQGPAGPAGPTGTTNVIYSDWFYPPAWTYYVSFSTAYEGFVETANDVTQDILDNGVILTYIQPVNTPGTVQLLPIENSGGGNADYFESLASLGNITFQYYNILNPTVDPGAASLGNEFRYILIPGSQLAGATHTKPLDYKDYNQVCSYYNIPK